MGEMNEFDNINGMNTAGLNEDTMQKESQALEITALVFGILALVICCCNGLFGVIGLILSVIALVKGKKNGKSIAALVCSILGVLGALIILAFSMSDAGKEFQDDFLEGFEEGYEMASGEDIEIGDEEEAEQSEEYEETPVVSNTGTKTIPEEEISKVVVDGNTITIPCKLKELLSLYEVSEYSKSEMESGLDAYESKSLFLAKNGEETGIYVNLDNYTEHAIDDIMEARVSGINIDDSGEKSVTAFSNLTFGMTSAEVDETVKDFNYNKSEMNGFVFYNIFPNADGDYYVSLMLTEDAVCNISVYYSGE